MSILNLGTPTITYRYQEDAKGSSFNQTFKNILAPGIYNGGGLSFVGNNITLAPYDALFTSTNNQLIAIHTSASIDLSGAQPTGFGLGAIVSTTPYIAMTFVWSDSTTVYPDYIFANSSILANSSYLILGMATFSGSVVTGFSYDNATYPPAYTPSSKQFLIKGTTDSTSSSTGCLITSGGVGIGKSLTVASAINASSVNTTSKRSTKKNIKPFKKRALDIINKTDIVSFNFKTDALEEYRVGFIADDTNEIIAGSNHDKMDITNTLGVVLKAIQELSEEIEKLKGENG
jgi:hypothetical protein